MIKNLQQALQRVEEKKGEIPPLARWEIFSNL